MNRLQIVKAAEKAGLIGVSVDDYYVDCLESFLLNMGFKPEVIDGLSPKESDKDLYHEAWRNDLMRRQKEGEKFDYYSNANKCWNYGDNWYFDDPGDTEEQFRPRVEAWKQEYLDKQAAGTSYFEMLHDDGRWYFGTSFDFSRPQKSYREVKVNKYYLAMVRNSGLYYSALLFETKEELLSEVKKYGFEIIGGIEERVVPVDKPKPDTETWYMVMIRYTDGKVWSYVTKDKAEIFSHAVACPFEIIGDVEEREVPV